MRIYLEGPDGAGKSTLAKSLAEHYDLPYMHLDKPANSAEMTAQHSHQMRKPGVYDRTHAISEFVYANVLRRENALSGPVSEAMIDGLLAGCEGEALVIMCLPSLSAVIHAIGVREEMAGVRENIIAIYGTYVNVLGLLALKYPKQLLLHDYVTTPEEAVFDSLVALGFEPPRQPALVPPAPPVNPFEEKRDADGNLIPPKL